MRTELKNLRQALTARERKSPVTIKNYLIAANRFLDFISNELPPSEKKLRRFFAQQQEDSIGPRTQNYYFIVIQQLYEANSWVWPLSRNDRPEISEKLPINVFTVDQIKTLIENRGCYSFEERFYLALATTFGMSRLELAQVDSKDIKNGKLHIKPIRHGKGRWTVIPPEIMPELNEYFPRQLSASTLSVIFKRILAKSDLEVTKGYSWFSIRTALWERLKFALAQNELPIDMADRYLRFSETTINARYPAMAYLVGDSDIMPLFERPFILDTVLLPLHPFVRFWQG